MRSKPRVASNLAPTTPAWHHLYSSTADTGYTSEDTCPSHRTRSVPLLVPCVRDSPAEPGTNWPDAHSSPSRQSLPRCAVVSFRKDGDSVRWHPAAPSNKAGLGASLRGFDSRFELMENSFRAIVPRNENPDGMSPANAAETQPYPPRRRSLPFNLRSNQVPAPRISEPSYSFAVISPKSTRTQLQNRTFSPTSPTFWQVQSWGGASSSWSTGKNSYAFSCRGFSRRFWRPSRSRNHTSPVCQQAVHALFNQNREAY